MSCSIAVKQFECQPVDRSGKVTFIRWLTALAVALFFQLCFADQLLAQDTLPLVKNFQKISRYEQPSGFLSSAVDTTKFGVDITGIGDLDNDGVPDMAVSVIKEAATNAQGGVYILFMNANGTVKGNVLITENAGGLANNILDPGDGFGARLAWLGVLSNDSQYPLPALAVMASGDDDGGTNRGAIYILFLNNSGSNIGTVSSYMKIPYATSADFTSTPSANQFSAGLASIGDINSDGIKDIVVGAPGSAGGGTARGGIWLLRLNANGSLKGFSYVSGANGWTGTNPFANNDGFGFGCAGLGDFDGDGHPDIAVSTRLQDNKGAVYIICLNTNNSVKSWVKIGHNTGGLQTSFANGSDFGFTLENLGDLNADGVTDLLVGVRLYDATYTDQGAAMVLYLKSNGTVQHEQLITHNVGLTSGVLGLGGTSQFGFSVGVLGDLNGDHVTDIAVGGQTYQFNNHQYGQAWVLELNPKPIIATGTITDRTNTVLGKISLSVKGGVRPYTYIWADTIPTSSGFTSWLNGIDTVGFGALHMPQVSTSGFTYSVYKGMFTPTYLDSLDAGRYRLTVIDQQPDSASTWFRVGYELKSATSTGVTVNSDKDVTKTSGNGWTNMEYTTKNLALEEQDGWVKFMMPQLGIKGAVGFRERTAAQSSGYHQMVYAYYFSGDSIYLWYDQALHYAGAKYQANNVFAMERLKDEMLYYRQEKVISTISGINDTLDLVMDMAIYTGSGKVEEVTTDMPSTFTVLPQVDHLLALYPASGAIALDVEPDVGTYTYLWGDSDTDDSKSGLSPGKYRVTVSSTYYQNQQTVYFDLGNRLYWKPQQGYSILEDGYGTTISRTAGEEEWSEGITTMNLARAYRDHWLYFTPEINERDVDGAIVGWREEDGKDVWAAWWVHGFGQGILAEAVSTSGVVARVFLKKGDVLGMSTVTTHLNFFVNGKQVAAITTPSLTDAYNTYASLRSTTSAIVGLHTSMCAPLAVNTDHVEAGIPYTARTSDALQISGTSGALLNVDLGTGPKTGSTVLDIPATSSTDAVRLDLQFGTGKVTNMRILLNSVYYTMDTTLYETAPPNELYLYDEHESRETEAPTPLFTVDLQYNLLMTPNDDQSFDEFKVNNVATGVAYGLTIMDRSSNVLFETSDPNDMWNGRYMNTGDPVEDGVYVYLINIDGTPFEGQFLLKN